MKFLSVTQNGNTALMFAAKKGKIAAAELMLTYGADIFAKNNVTFNDTVAISLFLLLFDQ